MKKYLYLLISLTISISLCSCFNKKNNQLANDSIVKETTPNFWTFDSLTLKQRIGGIHPDSINSGMEVDLFLEYPKSSPDSIDLIKIQQNIGYAFLGSDSLKTTPNEAFSIQSRKVIDSALEEVNAWKEWSQKTAPLVDISSFYDSRKTKIDSIIGNFMIVSTASYSFLGGAHGAYFIKYTTIDINAGETIAEDKLYNKGYKNKLAELIQKKIKERNNSTNTDDQISLLVKLKEIQPNDNFYLSDKGITYVYNQYEIAPYVQGVVEIFLPYVEVLPLIKDKYLLSIENIIKESKVQ